MTRHLLPTALVTMVYLTLGTTAHAADCLAAGYPGLYGGDKIQAAINDPQCTTVIVSTPGPDPNGHWLLATPILGKSNMILRGNSPSPRPVLFPTGPQSNHLRLLILDGLTSVTVQWLNWQANYEANTIIVVRNGSSNIRITSNVFVRADFFAVLGNGPLATSGVTVEWNLFDGNGDIDVRTHPIGDLSHSWWIVRNNNHVNGYYAVALANAIDSSVLTNTAVLRAEAVAQHDSGIDLNHGQRITVRGNQISGGCNSGITADDVINSMIESNIVTGCVFGGVVLANGAVPEYQPWLLSGNVIRKNTLTKNGWALWASGTPPTNTNNQWTDNILVDNAYGCFSDASGNVFTGNGPTCPDTPPELSRCWLGQDVTGSCVVQ